MVEEHEEGMSEAEEESVTMKAMASVPTAITDVRSTRHSNRCSPALNSFKSPRVVEEPEQGISAVDEESAPMTAMAGARTAADAQSNVLSNGSTPALNCFTPPRALKEREEGTMDAEGDKDLRQCVVPRNTGCAVQLHHL